MSIIVFGGTGTLGQQLVYRLLKSRDSEEFFPGPLITVFSRDELKQQEMRKAFGDVSGLEFIIGDIRDQRAVEMAVWGKSVIFHCAALKHVDVGESHPEEFFKTNVQGTMNIINAARRVESVKVCALSSTDKAVLPINTYGYTKALAEACWLRADDTSVRQQFDVFRWGNVVGSRGSAVQTFIERCKAGKILQLTHPSMTRFWITIEDAVSFFMQPFSTTWHGKFEPYLIPQMKAAQVWSVAKIIGELMSVPDWADVYETTGLRPGEKYHECLFSSHDHCLRSDTSEQYTDDELRLMLEPVVRKAMT